MPRGRPQKCGSAVTRAAASKTGHRCPFPTNWSSTSGCCHCSTPSASRSWPSTGNEAPEGLDENNVHHFHHALTAQLFNLTQLPTELLLEYDQNIVSTRND